MCVLGCRLELKWPQDKYISKVFTCLCVCVDDVVRLGVDSWRGCNFHFVAKGLKIKLLALSGR